MNSGEKTKNIKRSELIRMGTNYMRLCLTFVLGLWLVRLLLAMGEGVYAVIAIVGAVIGIANILQEMVRGTVVPIVGLAWHNVDKERFSETYTAAWLLSFIAAIFSTLIVLIFCFVFAKKMNIPANLFNATMLYLYCRIPVIFITVLFSPAINLLPITDKMAQHNLWHSLERAADVFMAFVVVYFYTNTAPEAQLSKYAVLSVIPMLIVKILWAWDGIRENKLFWSRFKRPSKIVLKEIFSNIGWNSFYVISMNMYLRLDTIITNIVFGISGTFVFNLAAQLLSYLRLVAVGIVQGFDAVIARTKSISEKNKHDKNEVAFNLLQQTSRVQAITTISLAFFFFLNISELLTLWIGDRLPENGNELERISILGIIMLPGVVSRSLSEGWMRYLSGLGEVKKYSLKLFVGAVLNPILIFILIYLLPEGHKYLSVAIAFSIILTVVHMYVLPRTLSRYLKIKTTEILKPFLGPTLLSILAISISIGLIKILNLHGGKKVIYSAIVFAIVFLLPALKIIKSYSSAKV